MKKNSLIFIFLALFTVACTGPKAPPEESNKLDLSVEELVKNDIQPLSIEENDSLYLFWPNKKTSYKTLTADYLAMSQDLMTLGDELENQDLRKLGHKMAQTFYKSKKVSSQFSHSENLFLQAAVAAEKESIKSVVNDFISLLKKEQGRMLRLATSSSRKFRWSKSKSIRSRISSVEKYLAYYLKKLKDNRIEPKLIEEFESAIQKDIKPDLKKLKKYASKINSNQSTLTILSNLEKFIKAASPEHYRKYAEQLKEGKQLSRSVSRIKTSKDVLSVIIALWKQLSPRERKKYFEKENKQFYDRMVYKSNKGKVDCVLKICTAKDAIYRIFILKELKDVRKYKKFFSKAIKDYILPEFRRKLNDIPQLVTSALKDEIKKGIRAGVQKARGIRKNVTRYAIKKSAGWAKKQIFTTQSSAAAIERIDLNLTLTPQKNIKVRSTGTQRTSPSTIGQSLALAPLRMKAMESMEGVTNDSPAYYRTAISQINKLLALGGFPKENGRNFLSFSRPLFKSTRHQKNTFSIADYAGSKDYFVTPNSFSVTGAYRIKNDYKNKSISVKQQADLLFGISEMLNYFKDWKSNGFDDGLAKIQIKDVIADLSDTTSIFPKELFYELALANSTLVMKNLILDPSLLTLYDTELTPHAGHLNLENLDLPTPSAAMFSIKKGKPVKNVRSEDLSRFIIALVSFYNATEGIEQSKSDTLSEAFHGNTQLAQDLMDVREKSKSLILALSNFLSKRMINPYTFAVLHELDPTTQPDHGAKIHLRDQALAIYALSKASKVSARVYRKVAAGIVDYINQNLWNPDISFYFSDSDRSIKYDPSTFLLTFKALNEALPDLEEETQGSIKQAMDQWVQHIIKK